MALLSELVSICAGLGLDSEPTLNVFARRLREAGRISQAGRGRNAAHMTFLDGARFLISCAATDHPEKAVDAEHVFSSFRLMNTGVRDLGFDMSAKTLDLALAGTLEALAVGRIRDLASAKSTSAYVPAPCFVGLRVVRSGSAQIRVLDGMYNFSHPATVALLQSMDMSRAATKLAEDAIERETFRFRTAKNITAELNTSLLVAVAECVSQNSKVGKS